MGADVNPIRSRGFLGILRDCPLLFYQGAMLSGLKQAL
jgi:hypothetical protein